MADEIAKALLAAELAYLPIPGTFTPQQPNISFGERMRGFSHAISGDIQDSANSVASALMAPGNALRGEYNEVEIMPDGSVAPFSGPLMEAAANMAGVVNLGSMPIPRPSGSIGMGGRPKNLPFSGSLSMPPAPTPDLVSRFGRVESVPISKAKATNPLQWERFDSGDHPPELVPGFGDKPVAVRKENGEYLIFDGHHRTALAASKGADSMEMYVIDAKDYAPADAGRKSSAPTKWSTADDDLMRELGF